MGKGKGGHFAYFAERAQVRSSIVCEPFEEKLTGTSTTQERDTRVVNTLLMVSQKWEDEGVQSKVDMRERGAAGAK